MLGFFLFFLFSFLFFRSLGFTFLDQAVKKKRAEERAKLSDKAVKEEDLKLVLSELECTKNEATIYLQQYETPEKVFQHVIKSS